MPRASAAGSRRTRSTGRAAHGGRLLRRAPTSVRGQADRRGADRSRCRSTRRTASVGQAQEGDHVDVLRRLQRRSRSGRRRPLNGGRRARHAVTCRTRSHPSDIESVVRIDGRGPGRQPARQRRAGGRARVRVRQRQGLAVVPARAGAKRASRLVTSETMLLGSPAGTASSLEATDDTDADSTILVALEDEIDPESIEAGPPARRPGRPTRRLVDVGTRGARSEAAHEAMLIVVACGPRPSGRSSSSSTPRAAAPANGRRRPPPRQPERLRSASLQPRAPTT